MPTDGQLLTRCASGDARAWDLLVERYQGLVFATARQQGLQRADAADVAQAAFIALLDQIDQIRDHDSVPYWLMTVARRQSWRVRQRLQAERPGEVVVAAEAAADWEAVSALHEAVGRLKSPCRELIAALYFDPTEPSYVEVARRLDRSVGGIGPLRGRCLDRLRHTLEKDGAA